MIKPMGEGQDASLPEGVIKRQAALGSGHRNAAEHA